MQREFPFFEQAAKAQWVPDSAITGWTCYRDAVVWCWANRVRNSRCEANDQAAFARTAGVHAPHMSRFVGRTKAPMDLRPDLIPSFEAYTGWRGVTQYMARIADVTLMERVIDARRAA